MDGDRLRALSGLRGRSLQGVLAALVLLASQGASRRLLGNPGAAVAQHLAQLLSAGPARRPGRIPTLRQDRDGGPSALTSAQSLTHLRVRPRARYAPPSRFLRAGTGRAL